MAPKKILDDYATITWWIILCGIILTYVMCSGCSKQKGNAAPLIDISIHAHMERLKALKEACPEDPNDSERVSCSKEALSDHLHTDNRAWAYTRNLEVDIQALKEVAHIDALEFKQTIADTERQRDKYKHQRWVYGAAGLVLGLVVFGAANYFTK